MRNRQQTGSFISAKTGHKDTKSLGFFLIGLCIRCTKPAWCRILNAAAKWDVSVGGNSTHIQKAGRVHATAPRQNRHQNARTRKFSKQFQHLPCLTWDQGAVAPTRPDEIEGDFNNRDHNHR